jgi:hypothetical protein
MTGFVGVAVDAFWLIAASQSAGAHDSLSVIDNPGGGQVVASFRESTIFLIFFSGLDVLPLDPIVPCKQYSKTIDSQIIKAPRKPPLGCFSIRVYCNARACTRMRDEYQSDRSP